MVILIGKSGSGKTTVTNILCKEFGFNRLVTTTTRPRRKGEKQGVDYNFVSEKEFNKMNDDGKFIEVRSYNVASGEVWHYGSPIDEILNAKDNDIIILTPEGCKKVIERIGKDNAIVIYLYANIRAIEYRLYKRGDSTDEINRRMEQDKKDFKDAERLSNFIVYNHYGDDINTTVSIMLKYLSKRGVQIEKT